MAKPVVVDSSIWIAYFRGQSGVANEVNRLMESGDVRHVDVILGELLRGARGEAENRVLHDLQAAFPLLSAPTNAWPRAGLTCQKMRAAGFHPGLADVYIALTAAEANVAVWSLDAHMPEIARHGGIALTMHEVRAK